MECFGNQTTFEFFNDVCILAIKLGSWEGNSACARGKRVGYGLLDKAIALSDVEKEIDVPLGILKKSVLSFLWKCCSTKTSPISFGTKC